MIKRDGFLFLGIPLIFLLGMLTGVSIDWPSLHKPAVEEHGMTDEQAVYTCPMHPHVHESESGSCPICGMPLVRQVSASPADVDNTAAASASSEVFVEPAVINNLGIRTAPVTRGSISRILRIYGYVSRLNERTEQIIHAPVGGKVIELQQPDTRQRFYKNDIMLRIESPEVMDLQQAYLQAVRDNDVLNNRLNKQKLVKLGFSMDELRSLVRKQQPSGVLTMRFSETGYLRLDVEPGQTVTAQQRLGVLTPAYALSAVARVFESQWTWLKAGQKVIMSNRSHPGARWLGVVRHVDELGNSSTTSVKLEADFEANEEVELRLGMQTEMDVFTESRADVLQVPTPAVIHYGSRSLVVVDRGSGHFQPVDVRTGLRNEAYTEILSGLDENMKVVVSGQFLIDSASSLQADLSRLDSGEQELAH